MTSRQTPARKGLPPTATARPKDSDVDTLAVGAHHRQLVFVRTGRSDVFLHCRPCFRRHQQDEEIAADQLMLDVAGQPAESIGDIDDDPVLVDEDAFLGQFEQA